MATTELTAAEEQQSTEPQSPEPGAFQDIPGAIWKLFLGAWAMIFLMFALAFTVNLEASFVVAISVGFALIAFGLPIVMAAQSRCEGYRCPAVIQTRTGPLSVVAAGAQIVAVPVCALIGLTAFVTFAL